MAEATKVHADGLPTPERYWAMLAIGLAITMAVLDSAIANVALPTIARELHARPAETIWVINAYQLAIVASLLPLAALGERVGYRRVYQGGLALFTAASLACALSHSLPTLVAARLVQGLGAAGIMSVNGALVRFTYPNAMLGRGVGLNALVVSMAAALGPTVASAILSVGTWQWLFAVNVPIGLFNVALAVRALPYSERSRRRFDYVSTGLNALVFGLFFVGVDALTNRRGPILIPAAAIALAVAAGAALIVRSVRTPNPLIPIDLLKIPVFALSVVTSIGSFAAQMLAFLVLPFYFQSTLHRDQVQTGLLMTPWPVAVGLAAPVAGWLSDQVSAAILGSIGLLMMALGLALLAIMPSTVASVDIAWRMAVCGLGFGLFQTPNNRTLLSSAPRSRAGAAGGMLATARLTGLTGGGTLAALFFRIAPRHAETLGLVVGVAFAVCAAAISGLRRTRPGPTALAQPDV